MTEKSALSSTYNAPARQWFTGCMSAIAARGADGRWKYRPDLEVSHSLSVDACCKLDSVKAAHNGDGADGTVTAAAPGWSWRGEPAQPPATIPEKSQ
jgi:hypothetical protein